MVGIKSPPDFRRLIQKVDSENYDKFQKYVSLANEKYLHWNDLLKDSHFRRADLEQVWAFVKLSRRLLERKVKLGRKHIIKYVQTPQIEKCFITLI